MKIKNTVKSKSHHQVVYFFFPNPHAFLMRSGLPKTPHHDSFAYYYGVSQVEWTWRKWLHSFWMRWGFALQVPQNPLQGRYHQESLTERAQMAQAVHQVCKMNMDIIIKCWLARLRVAVCRGSIYSSIFDTKWAKAIRWSKFIEHLHVIGKVSYWKGNDPCPWKCSYIVCLFSLRSSESSGCWVREICWDSQVDDDDEDDDDQI